MAYFFKENQDYIVKGVLLVTLQDLVEIYKTYPMLILANELHNTIEKIKNRVEAIKGVE